ncbi:MAG: hypothetical protein ABMA64_32385, partial [Myxococcota bacterium]
CGPAGTQRLRVIGPAEGVRVPVSLTSDCGSVSLGSVPVGQEVSVELPYSGHLRVPHADPQCGSTDAPQRPCAQYVVGERTARVVVTIDVGEPSQQLVVDAEGEGVTGTLTFAGEDPLVSELVRAPIVDGVARWPWKIDPFARSIVVEDGQRIVDDLAVVVDGVGRKVRWDGAALRVEPVVRTAELVVVDPDGRPVADALVRCDGLTHSGPDGVARCEAGEKRGAAVRARGYADAYTPFADPVVQVVLQPATQVRVGCAGMPGDRCPESDAYACYAGSDHSGTCSSTATGLVCGCSPDTTAIAHPVFGRADRPDDLPSVWFDLRAVPGSVTGPAQCELLLFGGGVWVEAGGPTLAHVPPGAYTASGRCPDDQSFSEQVRVGDQPVTLDPALRRTPRIVTAPPTEVEPDVERELLEYTFPAPPPGEPVTGSCEVRVTISAEGRLVSAQPQLCSGAGLEVAREALRSWRWAPGPAETTETLTVPYR